MFTFLKRFFARKAEKKCSACGHDTRVFYKCRRCNSISCNNCANVEDEDYGRIYCPHCNGAVEVMIAAA